MFVSRWTLRPARRASWNTRVRGLLVYPSLARHAEGRPHLPQDLPLPDDHRLQPAGHAEQVRDAIRFPQLVDVSFQLRPGHARIADQEVPHSTHQPDIVRVVGVHLGAVAGGNDDRLRHVFGQLRQRVGQLIPLHAETLPQLHRGRPVVQTQYQEAQLTASAARSAARLAQPPVLQAVRSEHISGSSASSN